MTAAPAAECLDDRLHRVKFRLLQHGHVRAFRLVRWLSLPLCTWIDRP